MKKLFTLLLSAFTISAIHAQTNTRERVVAEADYSNDGLGTGNIVFIDSMRYSYSGSRHSYFNSTIDDNLELHYTLFFDVLLGTAPDFMNIEMIANNADSAYYPHVSFDTLNAYVPDTNGNIVRITTLVASYNPDSTFNSVSGVPLPGGQAVSRRQVLRYSGGHIANVFVMQYNAGSWDTVGVRTITYNATGKIVLDSVAEKSGIAFVPTRARSYTYHSSGAWLTQLEKNLNAHGVLDTQNTIVNTYYPNGLLATSFHRHKFQDTLIPDYCDSFSYAPGVQGYLVRYTDYYSPITGGAYDGSQMYVCHLNAQNKKDSITFHFYDRNVPGITNPTNSYRLFYNAAGSPVSVNYYNLDPNGVGYLEGYTRWYYQQYNVGVGNIPGSEYRVTLAPNPTQGAVRLHYDEALTGKEVTASIINMAGQRVQVISLVLPHSQADIPLIPDLPPGQYHISVSGKNGEILFNGQFLKQ